MRNRLIVMANDSLTLEPMGDNPNTDWARIFVDELARSGLREACIAPGSRSTPLTLAFHDHPLIRVHLHLDERSAAFFGLGLALAQDTAVALVCTSGTAAVNFHPAIVEARYSQVPLLVLTADRPPELRYSGANQTIDQIRMYGQHVLWSVDVALPQVDAPTVAVRNLKTLAVRAFAKADGLVKGPVHLNFPFRKPLEPDRGPVGQDEEIGPHADRTGALGTSEDIGEPRLEPVAFSPSTRFSRGVLTPTSQQIDTLIEIISRAERGLIVCGPRCPGGEFPEVALKLSQITGYPMLADPLSGLRFSKYLEKHVAIGAYESFLAAGEPLWQEPQVVIRFGNVPTSKSLNTYLACINPRHRIHVSGNGEWADDTHCVTDFMHADATKISAELVRALEPRPVSGWTQRILDVEAACWQAVDDALQGEYFDGAVLSDVVTALPAESLLFAGNSLPVRHLDQFGRPQAKSISVYANRGASGIDGNVSTALGIGVAQEKPMVAVLGDITFYHDLNGLRVAGERLRKELSMNVTIVLLNNNGGGIFHRLPVSRHEPAFSQLFLTPHDLDFEPAARMYGFDFVRVEDRPSFLEAFAQSLSDPYPRVIEVRSDSTRDHARWQAVLRQVTDHLRQQFAREEAP